MDLPGDDSISWRVLRDKTPLVGGSWNLRLKNKPIIKPHTKKKSVNSNNQNNYDYCEKYQVINICKYKLWWLLIKYFL